MRTAATGHFWSPGECESRSRHRHRSGLKGSRPVTAIDGAIRRQKAMSLNADYARTWRLRFLRFRYLDMRRGRFWHKHIRFNVKGSTDATVTCPLVNRHATTSSILPATCSTSADVCLWEWPCENRPETHADRQVGPAPHSPPHVRIVAMSGATSNIEIIRFRL